MLPDGENRDLFEDALLPGTVLPIKTDIRVPDAIALAFTRSYLPLSDWSRRFHYFVLDVYDPYLFGDQNPYTYTAWQLPDFQTIRYQRISRGTGYADAVFEHFQPTPIFQGSQISWNGWGWDVAMGNGYTYLSPEAYRVPRPKQGSLVGIFDANGNEVQISRQSDGDITEIKSPNGKWVRFQYDGGRMIGLRDNNGNAVKYSYDSKDRLESVRYSDGKDTTYSYDDHDRIMRAEDSADNFVLENKYDSRGRLSEQSVDGHPAYHFDYTVDYASKTATVVVNGSQGKMIRVKIRGAQDSIFYSLE